MPVVQVRLPEILPLAMVTSPEQSPALSVPTSISRSEADFTQNLTTAGFASRLATCPAVISGFSITETVSVDCHCPGWIAASDGVWAIAALPARRPPSSKPNAILEDKLSSPSVRGTPSAPQPKVIPGQHQGRLAAAADTGPAPRKCPQASAPGPGRRSRNQTSAVDRQALGLLALSLDRSVLALRIGAQDARHRVVAFVAGILEHTFLRPAKRNL